MSETLMNSPFGACRLLRYPQRKLELLQAWDAADEYLLARLAEQPFKTPLMVVNDGFGALSLALRDHQPIHWSDSWMAQQAVRQNLILNQYDQEQIHFLHSLMTPQQTIATLVVKVPKSLALLEYQLLTLRPWLTADSRILLAGMSKHLPSTLWSMLERVLGNTQTSRAVKKAKVIEVTFDHQLDVDADVIPDRYQLEPYQLELMSHANVFSRQGLDIGTRFLLQHLPEPGQDQQVVDLGCGNGVLALVMAKTQPLASYHCVDESYMAVDSAQQNFEQLPDAHVSFYVSDGLMEFDDRSIDYVVCNPPFHQQLAVGDFLAMRLFDDARRVLRADGELRIVGNRHLNYHQKLKHFFGQVDLVESNKKFVILKATSPR